MRKKPSVVRSPVTKRWSYSSQSLVSSVALLASVRAIRTVSTPHTSAASRAATSLVTNSLVGTRTFPPRWPHFFTEASWSSKCTPAAPVDGLEPRLDLLNRLIAGDRREDGDVVFLLEQLPEPGGTVARERVLDVDGAAQTIHVVGRVRAGDAVPAAVGGPFALQRAGELVLVDLVDGRPCPCWGELLSRDNRTQPSSGTPQTPGRSRARAELAPQAKSES